MGPDGDRAGGLGGDASPAASHPQRAERGTSGAAQQSLPTEPACQAGTGRGSWGFPLLVIAPGDALCGCAWAEAS